MNTSKDTVSNASVERMFKAGAHFGYSKSKRHPSTKPYIFGVKNRVEIFDLEKTNEMLEIAKNFVRTLGQEGKQILFVTGKAEARDVLRQTAESLGMPYIAGRWIGGTITNFAAIRSRVDKLADLSGKREKGELGKYTKKERLLIDREIDNLIFYFKGLASLKEFPKAFFVIDPKREKIAVTEAHKGNIPVIALAGSDCDLSDVDFPIPGNDSSVASIKFFLAEIAGAYQEGKASAPKKVPAPAPTAPILARKEVK